MRRLLTPDLRLHQLSYGTRETPVDLRVLLYRGGAGFLTTHVAGAIERGDLGHPLPNRLPLVVKLHDGISGAIAGGQSHTTSMNSVRTLRRFFAWGDESSLDLTISSVQGDYKKWVESLLHRTRIRRDLKEFGGYSLASQVDQLLTNALGLKLGLRRQTRMKAPKDTRRILGSKADKQNLEETFAFGHALFDISRSLSVEAIRGPLPISVHLRTGQSTVQWCGLRRPETLKSLGSIDQFSNRKRVMDTRAAYEADTSLRTRFSVFNLRIDCELLIFVAQTGMNLAQAARLERSRFRFQSDGSDLIVYRVYKGRRGGEAVFRIFKAYRAHFDSYLAWLEQMLPAYEDARLFPYAHQGSVPSKHHVSTFTSLRACCKKLGIKCFRPQAIRKTRVNWLLRRSQDANLTAEMAQHTQQTLMEVYEQPNHQLAVQEITRFHKLMDPSLEASGPGACISAGVFPRAISGAPAFAPSPDCVSPAGCLFCDFHRDLDSLDYVWSLTSYRHLKLTELTHFHPPAQNLSLPHPAVAVIGRITEKLLQFKNKNGTRAQWVDECRDRVTEGRYHPAWDGFIQCMELCTND
ncbi:hypothetical protein JH262_02005 [Xanthomonas campestris pv. incanae]|uniref:hypothetical protein n=1 Tax=Xanthomonas campestris TaxID=339 RepID=UPI002367734D|nr:hypothetical protein [Xanthomonas campestris]WDJ98488.1 hypothetical protein JH262_02005 [Xanthomonas campestris pv. incanae]